MPFGRRARGLGAAAIVAIAGVAAIVFTQGADCSGSADPSGQRMPTGNLPGWRQVFADNFAQSVPLGRFPAAVRHTWFGTYRDGTLDTARTGTYMPTRV